MRIVSTFGVTSGGVWAASIALLLGCSGNGGQPSNETGSADEALRHSVPGPHGPPHSHGHHPHHPPGAGAGGSQSGAAGSASSGLGGASNGKGGSIASGATAGYSPGSGGADSASGGGDYGISVCGDGIWGRTEACDDGNVVAGDGCDASCQREPGWFCPAPGAACRVPTCGDGYQDSVFLDGGSTGTGGSAGVGTTAPAGGAIAVGTGGASNGTYYFEGCDDGNKIDGDGCSSTCTVETGWICSAPGSACHQMRCGDGLQDSLFIPSPGSGGSSGVAGADSGTGGAFTGTYVFEECDDGNTVSADGCSATCTIESGWLCEQPGTPCRYPRCGDGISDWIPGNNAGSGGAASAGSPGTVGGSSTGNTGGSGGTDGGHQEACDDGNTVNGDGCNASCEVEPGYSCWSGTCKLVVCGDGVVDWPVEECDDGNNAPGDGCASCRYEYTNVGGGGNAAGGPSFGGASPIGSGGARGR